jgi:SAM-dependent methyltransferase
VGIGMADVVYLSERGHIPVGEGAVLDIGSQNVFNVTVDAVEAFARRHGCAMSPSELRDEAERVSYFSTPRPGERTTYLSEIFDLVPQIFYTSYDVCPALRTEIFDLNTQDVPAPYRNRFDVVLNCGTTEHVINQMNSFRVMHDAVKPGGIVFHQVPSVGWLDHGYFTYHPTFFDDLVAANDYELVDRWFVPERHMTLDHAAIDVRSPYTPQVPRSVDPAQLLVQVQCFNITVIVRKVRDVPFRVGLELATSHAGVSEEIGEAYKIG